MARDERPPSAPEDCVHVDGEAYDVARWAPHHPGGDLLRLFLGRDATGVFAAFHGPLARRALKGLRARGVAPLAPSPELHPDVESAFAALRERARAEGLFDARPWFFYRRALFIVALQALSALTLAQAPSLWPVAALVLALSWQQAGWLSHDFVHHGVYPDRRRGHLVGALVGALLLGFSADWWRLKHNTHHSLPNVRGADTDIDTLPLLAFSEEDLPGLAPWGRALVRVQPWTFVPVLAFARLNWAAQSVAWALRAPKVLLRPVELAGLALHHALALGMLAWLPSWGSRAGFYLAAQLVSGLLTAAVFVVGHNARPMYERSAVPGFYELQCVTGQNVRAPWGTRWFFGGLEHQIEHHLFPTMPRHNLAKVSAAVQDLCVRYDVAYTERGFFRGLRDVVRVLARVARSA